MLQTGIKYLKRRKKCRLLRDFKIAQLIKRRRHWAQVTGCMQAKLHNNKILVRKKRRKVVVIS